MSPGSSSRKKPICQKCDHPMAGHKRPFGIPVCPRDESPAESAPAEYIPARASQLPDDDERGQSSSFAFEPSKSGYWHRSNPNWVNRGSPQPDPFADIPQRTASWVSTESTSGSHASPPRRAFPGRRRLPEVIDVDADAREDGEHDEGEGGDTQGTGDYDHTSDIRSSVSSSSSSTSSQTIMKRVSRGLSMVLGHNRPIASLYSSPRDDVTAITSAAADEGLYTRVVHHNNRVKTEPGTPTRTTPTRTLPTRDNSWWVAFGRDREAVDAIIEAQTPRKPVRRGDPIVLDPSSAEVSEPYDFERGLDVQRNERVGTFPEDPRKVRNSFFDTLVAGAVGGLVVFYCLSSL